MRLLTDAVTVRYPRARQPVLDGASFSVRTGESVAILGPSGSGKSTLLSVLGELLTPSGGEVRVEVDDVPVPLLPREITSWVLQTTNVFPERSALENVAIAASTRGVSWRHALDLAATCLAEVGLAARAGDETKVLSGGEVQRVVIARALASGRPFLLADEPTGQLDRATSETVLEAMLRSTESVGDMGVVVVTHDTAVAARCTRTVHIDEGKVVPG